MFIKHPISSGIALMLTCFIAFMTQASMDYEDEYMQYHAFSQVQEIKKDKKGQSYVLQDYDTQSGAMKGDTIQLSGDFLDRKSVV